VAASNSGGSRNEQLLFVRGFDRFQVPLTIDGIRVYLPADNRLDFDRFLTADLSQIQVAKGYVSVLNGPGTLSPASRKKNTKPMAALAWCWAMAARRTMKAPRWRWAPSRTISISLPLAPGA
jgi:iron complex outermembrane receptor protein